MKTRVRNQQKRLTRTFRLDIEMMTPQYDSLVSEVMSLATPTISVFGFDRLDLFVEQIEMDQKGRRRITMGGGSRKVRLKTWLPIACQRITNDTSNEFAGCYHTNADLSLFPPGLAQPLGPMAYQGEIIISTESLQNEPDVIRRIIAHELVHALHTLRFLVPAFENWPRFWRDVLRYGERIDLIRTHLADMHLSTDRYDTDVELSSLQEYWPKHAERWFNAAVPRRVIQ